MIRLHSLSSVVGLPTEIHYACYDFLQYRLLIASLGDFICAAHILHENNADVLLQDWKGFVLIQQKESIHDNAFQYILNKNSLGPDCIVDATPFQINVWKLLCGVPRGKTVSYKYMAENLGDIKMSRAVGAAVASNRLALIIPCHRAVYADGGETNFRWGREVKKRLMDWEQGLEQLNLF